jgi:hypothetical protein
MNYVRRLTVNELEQPAVTDTPPVTDALVVAPTETTDPTESPAAGASLEPTPPPVDPIRSAAGRLGGQRVHRLAELGREYEREHGLTPGRQRLKYLVQLGKRYEVEHGLRSPVPERHKKGDTWQEFLTALARVIKPAYRPAVEQLAAALRTGPMGIAADTEHAA